MNKLFALCLLPCALCLASCHSIEEYEDTPTGNFEQLWTLVDEHYCFFGENGLDWDSIYNVYAPRAATAKGSRPLFSLCAEMLDEVRDGHVNLSSPFETYYYRDWWSQYPQNYDARLLQQYYFDFSYKSLGPVSYMMLPQNIGYVRIATFENGLGAGNIDYILQYFQLCNGLIIDVRDNGGGSMTNVEDWVSRFITERTLVGYIMHKTGPGHGDFSEPYAYYYEPPTGHLMWRKPVVVLANRSTFSAANNFVSVMRQLPGVTVIGARTGGGSGMPISFELPCGWGLRLSAAPVLDAEGHGTESGVEPDIAVDMTPESIAAHRDLILDTAVAFLIN